MATREIDSLIGRDSDNADDLLRLCEQICNDCAAECEKFKDKDYCAATVG